MHLISKRAFFSFFFAIALLSVIVLYLYLDNEDVMKNFYIGDQAKWYNTYKQKTIKGKKRYTDNYKRKNIINSLNLKKKVCNSTNKCIFRFSFLQKEAWFLAKAGKFDLECELYSRPTIKRSQRYKK